MCANLADRVPVSATCGRGPAVAGATGMSVGHGPPPATRDCDAAPSLSTGHRPLRATRGRGLAAATTPSLLAGHGPLRATRGCGLVIAAGLRWTCGPDSSTGDQRQTTCSWKRRSQQS
jgi:hypothetical protein